MKEIQFYWVMDGSKTTMEKVWTNKTLSTSLVNDLQSFATQYSDVVSGWAMDYEEHYPSPAPAAKYRAGLTSFLRELTQVTGRLTNWWTGFLYSFRNVADIAAIRPYVKYVEFGAYWSVLEHGNTPCTNPHTFELKDSRTLVQRYNYTASQIVLGVGLSAYSWRGAREDQLAQCAYQGYLANDPSSGCDTSQATKTYADDPKSHSSVDGYKKRGRRWDEIYTDVHGSNGSNGVTHGNATTPVAFKGHSDQARGSYGPLSSYWIFYPDDATDSSSNRTGELAYWNDYSDFDRFVAIAKQEGFGGIFTWNANSDAADWRVHRHIHGRLQAGHAAPSLQQQQAPSPQQQAPSVGGDDTSGCDFSCASCSFVYPVTAVPCNSSSPAQHGWALAAQPYNGGLRAITYSGVAEGEKEGHHAPRCVAWNPFSKQVQVQACVAENGDSWVNRSLHSCQQWNLTSSSSSSSASSSQSYSGFIGAGTGCSNNEGHANGCLDIHSKVGPGLQLTRCYEQPNDNFTLSGTWSSQEQLPTYPQRCMTVSKKVCPFAGCCTACAAGFEKSSDGFCLPKKAQPAPAPAPERKAYIYLAIPTNSSAVDEAIVALVKHRASFTGVAYQYYGICGALAPWASKGYCSPQDSVGAAHLTAASYPAGVPSDIAERLRNGLGADTELIALISYGDTTDISLLQQLVTNETLTSQFTQDALKEAKRQGLSGFQFDFEPTSKLDWYPSMSGFLANFSAVLQGHGLHVGWDSNGPEGVPYKVSTWMDMGTYYGGEGYKVNMLQGIYTVGVDRFGLGYCPTCQQLKEDEVEERFVSLKG
jgi:hypothetical protein